MTSESVIAIMIPPRDSRAEQDIVIGEQGPNIEATDGELMKETILIWAEENQRQRSTTESIAPKIQ